MISAWIYLGSIGAESSIARKFYGSFHPKFAAWIGPSTCKYHCSTSKYGLDAFNIDPTSANGLDAAHSPSTQPGTIEQDACGGEPERDSATEAANRQRESLGRAVPAPAPAPAAPAPSLPALGAEAWWVAARRLQQECLDNREASYWHIEEFRRRFQTTPLDGVAAE
ncbi:MAG: hypothetical protein MMC23_001999 [Stictis urceolatum]|nr:hypothetical protein [Stictis urceolata]